MPKHCFSLGLDYTQLLHPLFFFIRTHGIRCFSIRHFRLIVGVKGHFFYKFNVVIVLFIVLPQYFFVYTVSVSPFPLLSPA